MGIRFFSVCYVTMRSRKCTCLGHRVERNQWKIESTRGRRPSSEGSAKGSLPRLKITQNRWGALPRSVHAEEERIGRRIRYQDVMKGGAITKKFKADNTSLR